MALPGAMPNRLVCGVTLAESEGRVHMALEHRDALAGVGYDAVMRTTVNIEDAQLRLAKELAERTHRSLGAVVTEALAMLLAHERKRPRATGRVELPVSGGGGLRPGVDLEDKDALYELLDMPDEIDEKARRAAG